MTETAAAKAPAVRRAKEKVPTPALTDYVVAQLVTVHLENDDELGFLDENPSDELQAWREVDRITTHGQEKAVIEKWANERKVGGTFKLVPARSWKGGVRVFEQTRMTSEPIA